MVDKEAMKLREIMEQAQVFASAWSLVGGRFDGGNAMHDAEVAKRVLHRMIEEALAKQENLIPSNSTELEKQEQGEPVAWYIREKDMLTRDANWVAEYPDMCEPLYTTPQQRKPLTDEFARWYWKACDSAQPYDWMKAALAAQQILETSRPEAAHSIKENI